MAIENVLASIAVRDLKTSAAWYEKLLKRPPDSAPMPEVCEWQFKRGGWPQIYQLPERAGGGSLTLAVDDIDEIIVHVRALGVDTSERSSNAQVKTLMIVDPDGNHIAFAQALDDRMA